MVNRSRELEPNDAWPHVQHSVDDGERQALRDEGLNPDDAALIAAIDLVRWELSLATRPPDGSPRTCPGHHKDDKLAELWLGPRIAACERWGSESIPEPTPAR